ncbi:MAG: GFA family protein, partial [Gammaproteobacteria bacterium]
MRSASPAPSRPCDSSAAYAASRGFVSIRCAMVVAPSSTQIDDAEGTARLQTHWRYPPLSRAKITRTKLQKGCCTNHRIAKCACKSVSITVEGEPKIHAVCHCANCKRCTGSAFGVSAYFPRSSVVATSGETNLYAFHHAEQNHDQERHFCAACGTTLFWYVSNLPELIGVAGGCFADDALGEPRMSA